jgi:hypothetical protein
MNQTELKTLREQIQENLRCALDGAPEEMLDAACQAVVDAFKPLITDELRIEYPDMAIVATCSDYLVDLIERELDSVGVGNGVVLIHIDILNMWIHDVDKKDILVNENTEHRMRLYEYLKDVTNKFKDDQKEPEYILFTD